jgi:S1/P1 Nuclease
VARLAWNKLTPEQRDKVTAILKKHPHYEEFLIAGKPDGFTGDEWAFMRAATWADWVRSHHAQEFNHGTWHYINYPVTFPGGGADPDKHQPPAGQENAVWCLNRCADKIRNGNDTEKAVYMTWLFHLCGDIAQPLHCVALYSTKYPDGDRGGNAIRIRIASSPTNLHSFWDGLLGRGTTPGSIGKDVAEIEAILTEKANTVQPDLQAHKTPDSWAREGAELARKAVYLDGELLKPRGGEGADGVLQAPEGYATRAGAVARVQVGKGGARLAEPLTKLFP